MDVILKYPRLREDKRYYVNIEYDCKSIQNECEFFYTKSLPKLIDLVPSNGTVDDVRIVYAYYA